MFAYRQRFFKRVFLLTCAALLVTQVLPSLAEELTPNPAPESVSSAEPTSTAMPPLPQSESETPIDEAAAEGAVEATPLPTPSKIPEEIHEQAPNEVVSEEFAELPTPPKARFADRQSIVFRAPGRYLVDPRATSALISPLHISSDELILLCLEAPGHQFQLVTTPLDVVVLGNGSQLLSLIGSGDSITRLFNAQSGVRVTSPQKIAPSQIAIGMGVLIGSPDDQSLCQELPINQRLNLMPLELTMTLVKNRIPIG